MHIISSHFVYELQRSITTVSSLSKLASSHVRPNLIASNNTNKNNSIHAVIHALSRTVIRDRNRTNIVIITIIASEYKVRSGLAGHSRNLIPILRPFEYIFYERRSDTAYEGRGIFESACIIPIMCSWRSKNKLNKRRVHT